MLEIGKVYRLSRKEKSPDVIEVDGLPNFFYETAIPHPRRRALQRHRALSENCGGGPV